MIVKKMRLSINLLSIVFVGCLFPASSFSQQANWGNKPFDQRVFIENKGQFDNPLKNLFKTDGNTRYSSGSEAKILFGASSSGVDMLFSNNGLLYKIDAPVPLTDDEKEEYAKAHPNQSLEETEEGAVMKMVPRYLSIDWIDANPNAEIISEAPVSFYFTYGGFDVIDNQTIKASAFKKITYKNLYPNIDLEYTFPNDSIGVKYNLIVHPGGDISKIKMKYKNAENISLLPNGNIKIETAFGDFIDHAPITFYSNNQQRVKSSFVLSNNTVVFSVDATTRTTQSGDIIIDPWTTNPTYTGFNSAYDVNFDGKGNVYTHGSYSPYKVAKFNSSGVLQWIFNASLGSTFVARITYGDFAVDETSSSVYVTEGYNNSGTGARILKVNPAGTQVATFGGTSAFQEMWRAEYNRCFNKIVIAGGGHVATQAAVLDTTLASLTSRNVLSAAEDQHDMCMLAVDNVSSNAFMATARSGSYPANFDNIILKCPIPALTPINTTFGMKKNYHNTKEVRSVIYVNSFTPAATLVPTNAFNGMAVSPNWLYTYNSDSLKRWNKTTGAYIQGLNIDPNPPLVYGGTVQIRWGGIAVDECDHLYIGFAKTIQVYDSSLTLINTYNLADTVYDIKIGNNNKLYACGKGFVTELSIPANPISTTSVNATGCGACDGTATVRTCGGGTNPGVSYSWNTSPVQTTQTATGLCPGTYIVTVNASCVVSFKDTIVITGTPAATPTTQNITFCQGSSFTLPDGGLATATGVYKDTVQNGNGCDSIITTNITVTPALTFSQNPVICYGSSFALPGGGVAAATGTYKDTVSNAGGCDSIVTTNLTVSPLIASTQSPIICSDANYTLPGGNSVNTTGTYHDTLTGNNGCDSVVTTVLTVNPVQTTAMAPVICPGSSYVLPGGTIVSAAGTFIDTLATSRGCDSIITTTLSLSNWITISQNPVICQGTNFTLPDNSVVTTTGVYIDTLTTSGGCDSVVTTNLTVNPVLSTSLNPVICSGTIYSLPGGGSATTTGVYIDTLSTFKGCDSIITTSLTVNPVFASTNNVSICYDATYTLPGGTSVNTAGNYIDTLSTYKGCDSIITTALTIIQPLTSTRNPVICYDTTYTLPGGNVVNTTGVYSDTLTAVTTGCDSIITTNLTVIPVKIVNQNGTIVCQGQSYTLPGGGVATAAGVYHDTLTAASGCDSVVITTVTMNPSPIASFSANPTSGVKPLTVNFTNTSQNANTYFWLFGDGASSTVTNPTHIYTTPGTYVVMLIASTNNQCPDTAKLTIIVFENFDVLVPNVFTPNGDGTNDVFTVSTEGVRALDAEIYDRWGLKMYEWHTTDGGWDGYTSAGLPASDGTYYYIIKLTELNGKTHYIKGPFTLIR